MKAACFGSLPSSVRPNWSSVAFSGQFNPKARAVRRSRLTAPWFGSAMTRNRPVLCAWSASAMARLVASDMAAFFTSRIEHRAEQQLETPLADRVDFLLGRIDAGGATSILGGLDAAGELVEIGGQIGRGHAVIGQLRLAADDRALGGVELHRAVGRDTHGEDHRRPGAGGQQAGGTFGQDRRIEPGLAVGQILRGAAMPCLGVKRIAVIDEPGDVGDGIMEQQIGAAAIDAKAWSRSVELAGSSVTKGRSVRSTCSVGVRFVAASAAASTAGGKDRAPGTGCGSRQGRRPARYRDRRVPSSGSAVHGGGDAGKTAPVRAGRSAIGHPGARAPQARIV